MENKEQMRQATAYVDVKKEPASYDFYYDQEYEVFTDRMKVGELCRSYF